MIIALNALTALTCLMQEEQSVSQKEPHTLPGSETLQENVQRDIWNKGKTWGSLC